MTLAPLCIIQARIGSNRLPGKVLLKLGGMTLLERAWRTACDAFGKDNVVIAYPDNAENQPIGSHASAMGAQTFAWVGDENDVLGRFYACASTYRWLPESIIVRWTPDDPFKSVEMVKRVVEGERLPVELGAEAFTLDMLGYAEQSIDEFDLRREHITNAIFDVPPPPAPHGIWTVDTQDDYEAACRRVAGEASLSAVLDSSIPRRKNRGKESVPPGA